MALVYNTHGKSRVRVVKVNRSSKQQTVCEYTVELLLEGEFERSYLSPDNSQVVPTDTCKSLVYVVAKEAEFTCGEEFGLALGEKVLGLYSHVTRVCTALTETVWERAIVNGSPHPHSFERRPHKWHARVVSTRQGARITSGISGITFLKTTASGFVNYHMCPYTRLVPTTDRLLGTTMNVEWTYKQTAGQRRFAHCRDTIFGEFAREFCNEYSYSVQNTMYVAAKKALEKLEEVYEIQFELPNIHNWEFDIGRFGLVNNGEIYFPTDEPHGTIRAVVRSETARL